MQSAQKEIIIQHLFSRECETLRQRKQSVDSASGTPASSDLPQ
jgi:hypothetical protein